MNKELKTLKDLGENECGFGEEHVSKTKLKQEAIKWVKFTENNQEKFVGLPKTKVNMQDLAAWCATEEWIKHFFNITEEDLK